ncbi:ATP-dependent helicase, partial [Kitasatospora sp. NPDC052868]
IPTVIAAPVVERPRRSASTSRGRRSRPAYAGAGARATATGRDNQGSSGRRRAPRRVALAA